MTDFHDSRDKLNIRREVTATALEEARARLGPLQLDVELGTGNVAQLAEQKRLVADLAAELDGLELALVALDTREQEAIAKAAADDRRTDQERAAAIRAEIADLASRTARALGKVVSLAEQAVELDHEYVVVGHRLRLSDPDRDGAVSPPNRDYQLGSAVSHLAKGSEALTEASARFAADAGDDAALAARIDAQLEPA